MSAESECSTTSSNATTQNGRSFSSNTPPIDVTYKGSGVGWGSGRGKPSKQHSHNAKG